MPELGDTIADETINVKFVTNAQTAIAEAKKLREEINALKKTMQSTAEETKETASVAAQAVLNTTQGMAKGAGALAKKEFTTSTTAAKGFTGALSSLGSIGKFVFGSVLGITAIGTLKNVVQWLQQAAQYGYEFSKSIYQLQIGINAIRRTGTEITLQDVYKNLDKLQSKFGVFSRKELVEGSAALINLTRDFGYTKEEIFALQDAIATLAVVNGRAMDEVQRTVALAISSGYTEGLQRLGVSINRVTIALEAQRLGYGRNYMSLTEQQRAQATYNLILQKTAKYQNDLETYQRTAPGRIDAAKVAFTNLATTVGETVIPVWADLVEWLGKSAKELDDNIKKARELAKTGVFSYGSRYGSAAQYTIVNLDEGMKEPVIETGFLKNRIEEEQKMAEELPPIAEEIGNKLLEIEEDFEDRSANAWEDYLQDKEDLLIQYGQKAEDIERQLVQKLEDLDIKVAQQNEDAWTNYYRDLEDINTWYNQAVEEANYDHQQDLLKAEEDFQNKMRDLRQSFLFDLEDAIRERDAKQAMLLIRQYNFDRQQAEQNRDDNIEDINRQYKIELAELKKQKARKLIELKDELNRRLAEIQLEYQRELEELAIWKQREYEERELWYQRELTQAKTNYERQLEEANTNRDKQLRELAKDMNKEYNLQGRHLNNLYKLIEAYIGPTGYLTKLWEAYNTYVGSISAIPSTLTPAQQFHWGGSFANGGEITVSKPTLAMFGERGTETATFTKGSKSSGAKGKIQIELLLSPDLEARIIDSAVGEVASEFETAISIKR